MLACEGMRAAASVFRVAANLCCARQAEQVAAFLMPIPFCSRDIVGLFALRLSTLQPGRRAMFLLFFHIE